jgi:hypothetical protein
MSEILEKIKSSPLLKKWWFWLVVIGLLGALFGDDKSSGSSTESSSSGCQGYGTAKCVSEAERLVRGTGREVASAVYKGNGEIWVECFDWGPGGAYSVIYHMDCNCQPTNVIVR